MKTLLLNASYEPLAVVSHKRAVVLIIQDKAEIVEATDERIHSASEDMPVPSVIRLKYFVKVPFRARLPLNRQAVLTRDGHRCQFVGCQRRGTTIDHVQPRSRGGAHAGENVVAACKPCNSKKADKTLDELGWKLRWKPRAPRGVFWLVIGITDVPEAWAPYLGDLGLAEGNDRLPNVRDGKVSVHT